MKTPLLKNRFTNFQQYLAHEFEWKGDAESAVQLEAALPLIGWVVMYFNTLEKTLDRVICETMSDRSDALGLLVIAGMQFSQKVDLFSRLCDDLHAGMPVVSPAYNGVADALRDAAKLRNLVVHADWHHSDAEGYTYTRLHIRGGAMRQEYAQLTREALELVSGEILVALNKLQVYEEQRSALMQGMPWPLPLSASK